MKKCCEEYLNEQFGGDADVIGEIYGEYVASVNVKIAEAESLLKVGDWQPFDHAVHTIKGNALSVGDKEMADVAIALRKAAALKDSEEGARLVAAMKGFAQGL